MSELPCKGIPEAESSRRRRECFQVLARENALPRPVSPWPASFVVYGLGFGFLNLEFQVSGVGFWVLGLGFLVLSSGF